MTCPLLSQLAEVVIADTAEVGITNISRILPHANDDIFYTRHSITNGPIVKSSIGYRLLVIKHL